MTTKYVKFISVNRKTSES